MQKSINLNKIVSIFPILVAVFSIGVLSFHLTPCNIASGQVVCSAATDEKTINPIVLSGELNVGATPIPGAVNQILTSGGANSSPSWGVDAEVSFDEVVYKAVDTTITNDNTVNADPELFFTGDASSLYLVEIGIFYTGDVTQGFKYQFPGTSGFCGFSVIRNGASSDTDITCGGGDNSASGNNGKNVLHMWGFYDTNPNVLFEFKWSQVTANSNNLTVNEGSYIKYRKLQ